MKKKRLCLFLGIFILFAVIISPAMLYSCDKTDDSVYSTIPVWLEETLETDSFYQADITKTILEILGPVEKNDKIYIIPTVSEIDSVPEQITAKIDESIENNTLTEEIITSEFLPGEVLKMLVFTTEPPPTEEPPDESSPDSPDDIFPESENTQPEPVKIQANGDGGVIALTFDDGPSPYTERLLEILSENESKATFFIVGYKTDSHKDIIKKISEQGSQVCGHSWNHPDLRKISDERVNQEVQATNDAIYNITGIYPNIYRVPYGAFNDRVKNLSKDINMAIIQWNIDPNDWKYRNANTVYYNVMTSVKDGCIICMHDTHATTVEAMERVIPELIAAGYKLVTVSELLGETEPGTVYYSRK